MANQISVQMWCHVSHWWKIERMKTIVQSENLACEHYKQFMFSCTTIPLMALKVKLKRESKQNIHSGGTVPAPSARLTLPVCQHTQSEYTLCFLFLLATFHIIKERSKFPTMYHSACATDAIKRGRWDLFCGWSEHLNQGCCWARHII